MSVDPFFYYSQSFPRILKQLSATLLYSTYQAGKVVMISSPEGKSITKYGKNFKRPMGIAVSEDGKTIAIASKSEVGIFTASDVLSVSYPERPQHYSHLYIPQAKYHTGIVDTHEIAWSNNELIITNTLFSCISKMSYQYHFEELWRPPFITDIAPEDRCHLNGVALVDGKPRYITMFAQCNEEKGWRNLPYNSGVLMDTESGEILIDQLPLPHSPVYFDEKIYFLLSATGEVMYYDIKTKETKKLHQFNSFVRGLEVIEDYIFLGMSKIREGSQFFSKLPIKPEDSMCGIRILDRHRGDEVAGLTYTERIQEIFAVKIAKGVVSPGILTERDEYYEMCLASPDNRNYWLKQRNESIIT